MAGGNTVPEAKSKINLCYAGRIRQIDLVCVTSCGLESHIEVSEGVYLLTCKETGKQYVGSAKGDESLWGRFLDYPATRHGGNIELKRRGRKSYQVTVLDVVNSDFGIELIEEVWKRKLLSREFGLNRIGTRPKEAGALAGE